MVAPITWFPLAILLVRPLAPATPSGSVLSHPGPPPALCASRSSTADTTPAAEPPLVPLTEELVKRYLAVRPEVFAFLQAHPAVITARVPVHVYTLTMRGPSGGIQGHTKVEIVDFAALAAQTPAMAAIFAKHHFPPAQFVPVTMTLRKVLFAAALHQQKGWAIKDPASIEGKNITFVEVHAQDFVGSPLAETQLQR